MFFPQRFSISFPPPLSLSPSVRAAAAFEFLTQHKLARSNFVQTRRVGKWKCGSLWIFPVLGTGGEGDTGSSQHPDQHDVLYGVETNIG